MEPLSAFAVACNVLQVADQGFKLLRLIVDSRKSTDRSDERTDLRHVYDTLEKLNVELQSSLPQDVDQAALSLSQIRLIEANEQCLNVAREFSAFLDKLKIKDRNSFFHVLHQSLKTLWWREKRVELEQRVASARGNLNIAILVYMNSKHTNQSTPNALIKSNSRLEEIILDAVERSAIPVRQDVERISQQLEHMRLDRAQYEINVFLTNHRDFMQQFSSQIEKVQAQDPLAKSFAESNRGKETEQRILHSLSFPGMNDRKDHVHIAYENTYKWMLDQPGSSNSGDNFLGWLQSAEATTFPVFWISGKAGSGKSTLMNYLYNNLEATIHFSPWNIREDSPVIFHYFFWNPGDNLQRSPSGFLRSILFQIFTDSPQIIHHVVSASKMAESLRSSSATIHWSFSELKQLVQDSVTQMANVRNVLILVDGLDEIGGSDDDLEEVVDFIVQLSRIPLVKVCLSSRPWNIFQDILGGSPKLQLEILTSRDISQYVHGRLTDQRRFKHLQKRYPVEAEHLIYAIIQNSQGVFLWVYLVVRELLKAIRDGENIESLEERLSKIPTDLNQYFTRIWDSIEAAYKTEAAILFNILLFREDCFQSVHPLRLIDVSYIRAGKAYQTSMQGIAQDTIDLRNQQGLDFELDTIIRRVNSRCKGLLECHFEPLVTATLLDLVDGESRAPHDSQSKILVHGILNESDDSTAHLAPEVVFPEFFAFDFTIDFLHRSLRDYFAEPEKQRLLHSCIEGTFDVRVFLIHARVAQVRALKIDEYSKLLGMALLSYIFAALSLPYLRTTELAARLVQSLKQSCENIISSGLPSSYWYINESTSSWAEEQSTFLTLTIDFGLLSYVKGNLTPKAVQGKAGRPILDYVLRPRFHDHGNFRDLCLYSAINLELLEDTLRCGADPNALYHELSSDNTLTVWTFYLRSLHDEYENHLWFVEEAGLHAKTMTLLLRHGAAMLLPVNDTQFRSWPLRVLNASRGGSFLSISDLINLRRPPNASHMDELQAIVYERASEVEQE